MHIYWLVEISVCILVGGDKCMDIGCIEVSVWILVVWRQVYVYWLVEISVWILVDGDKCMDIGCIEASVWILVGGDKCMDIGWWR